MRLMWMTAPLLALAWGCKKGPEAAPPEIPKAPAKVVPASVKSGDEGKLFPFAVGNSWVYSVETVQLQGAQRRSGTAEITYRIAKVEDKSDGKYATMELVIQGKVTGKQLWLSNSKGLYQAGVGQPTGSMKMYDSPQPIILFPADAGKKFTWDGQQNGIKYHLESRIDHPEEVDTDEKRVSAIKVISNTTQTKGKTVGKSESMIWLSPGIGMVRLKETTVSGNAGSQFFLRLKSHTLK